jgi:hypothetical protein
LFAIEQISRAPAAAQSKAQIHAAERARAGADCVKPACRYRLEEGRGEKAGLGLE